LHSDIEANDARSPEAIKQQLKLQVDKLVENNAEFDEQRLYQEVAILAAKADLQEELDRLVVHVKAAEDLIGLDMKLIIDQFREQLQNME